LHLTALNDARHKRGNFIIEMKTIVVGTDFSPAATNALNYAVELVRFLSAKLILVHAFSQPIAGYDSLLNADGVPILKEAADRALADIKEEILTNDSRMNITCISELGTAFHVIQKTCLAHHADLTTMGLVGAGDFLKRHVIGSYTIHAARHLGFPLLIIPNSAKYRSLKRICFACDPAQIKESPLFLKAINFSGLFEAVLEILTVKDTTHDTVWKKSKNYQLFEKRGANVINHTIYRSGQDTSEALLNYLRDQNADCVIVNPEAHHWFTTLFKPSVTKNLAFELDIPLLALH
jgi:nucleotide-binding universal stress UspA family protein